MKCVASTTDTPGEDPRFGAWGKQKCEDTGPLTKMRMETAQHEAGDYVRWFVEHAFVVVPAQSIVAQHLASFVQFPPLQEPGSFSVEQAMEKLRNPPANNWRGERFRSMDFDDALPGLWQTCRKCIVRIGCFDQLSVEEMSNCRIETVARNKGRADKSEKLSKRAATLKPAGTAADARNDGANALSLRSWKSTPRLAVLAAIAAIAMSGLALPYFSKAFRAGATAPAAFAGSEACAGCHPTETALWKDSQHKHAMQHATADSVLGDFDNAGFDYLGVHSRFFK
jgi:hypothetical protein